MKYIRKSTAILLCLCILWSGSLSSIAVSDEGTAGDGLVGATNGEKIWNYFKVLGYNDFGCAGILGNLFCESGLNPNNLENSFERILGYTDASYTAGVDNGTYSGYNFIHDSAGYGIAQWTFWSRKELLYNLAKERDTSIADLETQLLLLQKELKNYGLVRSLQNAGSILEASNLMLLKFEKPADQSEKAQTYRASICQTYFDTYERKNTTGFTDLHSSDYFYDAVLWAIEKGVTTGTSQTTFSPNANCTRGQMVSFLWRAAGCPEPSVTDCPFLDVNLTDYYGKAVLWAVENGITTGTAEDAFSPDASVTRGQTVTFLYRLFGKGQTYEESAFTDVTPDAYYYDAVLWAQEAGVTQGMTADTFCPDKQCQRCQIVTFLYRCYH